MPRDKKVDFNNNCITPIHLSSSYFFRNTEQVIQYHREEVELGRYGRYDNLNCLEAERRIAALDGCQDALLFSTGMNAITTTLLTFTHPGDRVILTGNCYRNTRKFCTSVLTRFGVEVILINSENTSIFQSEILSYCQDNKTKVVFIEMPSNPHLYLTDIEYLKCTISADTLLIVDSTLSSPYNFQPQKFGTDLVIHSCTKYLNGHGDLMAGSVSGCRTLISEIRDSRKMMGGISDPHSAYLLNRSLDTFEMRMQHFNRVGLEIAQYLETSPFVKRVFYTGLASHPHALLASKYLTGHGGIISFEIDGDQSVTSSFVDALKVPFMGSNFGSNVSMVEQCSLFTYYKYSDEERHVLGITDNLVRLSIGYENIEVILADLEAAMLKIKPCSE